MTRTSGTTVKHGEPHRDAPQADVLVVGAGPTGLTLAGDLAASGLSVTLLERRTRTAGNLSRAFAVHARTLEQLDARPSPEGGHGLADDLLRTGQRVRRLRLFRGLEVDLGRLRSRFPFVLVTPQYEVETVLERRAIAAGVHFSYGTEVVGLDQDADGVTLLARDTDGGLVRHRAAYAVGTDGHRSTVRQALGIPFPGHSVIRSMALADVRLGREPENVLTVNATGDSFAFVVPFGDGWYRVMCWDRRNPAPVSAPLDVEEIKTVTRRTLGTDLQITECRWLSRFHSDERQAPAYRVGRVLLAGDAAHVHSPAGGQGMNTGIQDAVNLGWKLTAVLRDGAPATLLDSYERERHPVGRMVLRSSGALIRLAMTRTPVLRGLRDLATGIGARIPVVTGRAMGLISGVGIRYRTGGPGAHRLAGRRAPDLRLAPGTRTTGPTRLYEALREGRFVLVVPQGVSTAPAGATEGTAAPVRVVTAAGSTGPGLLVRPDGYIAWAGNAQGPGREAGALREVLQRWGVAERAARRRRSGAVSSGTTPA